MRYLLVLAGLFSGIICFGQIQHLTVGINGLTCSQCSRSVELQLRKLSFIKDVSMNLQQTEGTLSLVQSNTAIPFDEIAQAVKDAGFSVRFLTVTFTPETLSQIKNKELQSGADRFYIVNAADTPYKTNTFQFVGKIYMPPTVFKKYKKLLPPSAPDQSSYWLIPSGK